MFNITNFKKEELDDIKCIVNNCRYFTMGGDPEFFIIDQNNDIVPSDRVLSTKNGDARNDAYTDGVQGELAISEHTCRDIVASGIRSSLSDLNTKFKIITQKFNSTKTVRQITNLKPKLFPIIKLTPNEMKHLGKASVTFGCKPDYNTYKGGKANRNSLDGRTHEWRYGGGHIHIQMRDRNIEHVHFPFVNVGRKLKGDNAVTFIKLLDIFVGMPSVILTRDNEKMESLRRSCYGRAGDYRQTEYGIEYRTLSNFWLLSPTCMSVVFGLARIATNFYAFGDKYIKQLFEMFPPEEIRKIIDESDVKSAEKMFKKLKPLISSNADDCHWITPFSTKTLDRKCLNGLFKYGVFKFWNDESIFTNWGIVDIHGKQLLHKWDKYGRGFNDSKEFINKQLDFFDSVESLDTLKPKLKCSKIKQTIKKIRRC